MSARAKKILPWLWIAALLSSTMGLSVHTIYCYCTGNSTFSFFEPADSCNTNKSSEHTGICCSVVDDGDLTDTQEAGCCSKTESAVQEDCGKDCTQKSTVVFQLKTEFLVETPLEKDFNFPLWLEEMPFLKRLVRPALCEMHYLVPFAEPPPPDTGRMLCVRHHSFLC